MVCQNQRVAEEREKRQKINELKAQQGRDTATSHESIKDELHRSYNALNEKGFEHHYDYLYERALVARRTK